MRIAYLNPYRNSAENQIFRSMREAGSKIGLQLHECRNEVDIYACDPAFVVSVSSHLPKMTHHQTYLTVHEPKAHIFDFEARFRNIMTYDGYLTVSDSLVRFVRDFSYGVGRSEEPGFFYLTPQKSDLAVDWTQVSAAEGRQVAYFGTNRRRMPLVVEELDRMDILRIHGPRASWENQNYRSYCGPVTFDGKGPQQVYAACGVGLVLADDRWIREDVVSNGIFEISSVGAVSICPDMPWFRKWFGDSVLYYDADRPPFEIAEQIRANYQFCLDSPDQAIAKAAQARSVFETTFSAEKMLENLIAFHAQKTELCKAALAAVGPQAEITVIVRCGGRDAPVVTRAVNSIRDQTFGRIHILFAKYRDIDLTRIMEDSSGAVVGHDAFLIPGGGRATMLYEALKRVKTTYFAVLDDDDQWLPNHFESLFAAGRRVSPDFDTAFSGRIDIDHPFDVDTGAPSNRSIYNFGHRKAIQNAWDIYHVMHLSSMVARSDLLTPALLEVPDMRTAEDSLLVGLLSRRSKPVFSYRATFLYSRNSVGGSNWETDAQRIEDEISLILRGNLAFSPEWIAGGEIAGAMSTVTHIKPGIGQSSLGEFSNRVMVSDIGRRSYHDIYCPPWTPGQLFSSRPLAFAAGNYLITLVVEIDPNLTFIHVESLGAIDVFTENNPTPLTTFEIPNAAGTYAYQFSISTERARYLTHFQLRSRGECGFTVLSIGLHRDSNPDVTLARMQNDFANTSARGNVKVGGQTQQESAENQEKKRGMNKSFKKIVNSTGLYISSMKSHRWKEERLKERDAFFARALDRDRLAADKDRLAAEMSDLISERDVLFDERNTYYLERNALQAERETLFADIDHLFGMVLDANSGGSGKAQLNQDVMALIMSRFKKGGFFVEFGATNGVDLSNTYLLEKDYGWTGILAEPATMWHEDLANNRRCLIDTDCVWSTTGETLDFDMVNEGEFSTLSSFSQSDNHAGMRKNKMTFKVKTISLMDLLAKHNAPGHIDYLSVDTEGSEYDILKTFDFDTYRFSFISVEHNYTDNRERLRTLLQAKGYRRICEHLSRWDDWYIPAK